jgi:hypothetical protein
MRRECVRVRYFVLERWVMVMVMVTVMVTDVSGE